jgi:pimeloyl-ACP methyl ester carboxylesterase
VTLLSPAGLWRSRTPLYCRVSLRTTRFLAALAPRLLGVLVRTRAARYVVFRQTHARPRALSAETARRRVLAMATCPGFPRVMRATSPVHYTATRPIEAPVTVAFGDKDLLLLRRQSRHLDELPPHTVVAELPGCGHVPMGDDPAAVTALVRAAAADGQVQRGA